MSRMTKGTIEADIAAMTVRLQREHHGRGAAEIKAYLVGDMILVRCNQIFTSAELHLSTTEGGKQLIKQSRAELHGIVREELETAVAAIVGCKVLRSYTDMDVQAAELIEVYVLEQDVEKRLLRQDLDRLGGVMPGKRSHH